MVSKETKHLLQWQKEWLKRFFLTTYHLFNRKAYHKLRRNKYLASERFMFDSISFHLDSEEF